MAKNVFAGIGISKAADSFKAGKESVEMAMEEMKKHGSDKATFGLVFCSGGKYGKDDRTIQKLVDGAHSVFGDTPWVGCTTGGEISPYGSTMNSVVAMVISSEYVRFGVGVGKNISKTPKAAGKKATKEAFNALELDVHVDAYLQYMRTKKHKPVETIKMVPYAILLLGKGPEKGMIPKLPKMYDLEEIFQGIVEEAGYQIPIIGGGSFDDWLMKRNYHFKNGEVLKDAIIVVAIMCNTYFSSGLAHGYKPSGKIALVNNVKKLGGVYCISKLNNEDPIKAYAKMAETSAEKVKKDILAVSSQNPVGLVDPFGEPWVRLPGGVVMGNLCFATKIKENTTIQLMKGTEEEIFGAYAEAAKKALKQIEKKKPALVFVFSCSCRNKVFKRKIGKEIEIFKKYFPKTPFIGFYSFGEFGGTLGYRMGVHNQTVTVLVVSDELMV